LDERGRAADRAFFPQRDDSARRAGLHCWRCDRQRDHSIVEVYDPTTGLFTYKGGMTTPIVSDRTWRAFTVR
jgi:hypothetical protein